MQKKKKKQWGLFQSMHLSRVKLYEHPKTISDKQTNNFFFYFLINLIDLLVPFQFMESEIHSGIFYIVVQEQLRSSFNV